jgi:tetratricopeptide (TPR) repeat protein
VLLLGACASAPPLPPASRLLHDELLAASPLPINADEVAAASPEMKRFAAGLLATPLKGRDLRLALIDAMHKPGALQLRYDSSFTRTAAEAFEARAGNCLSLVMMTAALARELGLQVTYQTVLGEDSFTRDGALVYASGHVNLVLGRPATMAQHMAHDADRELTVDFLPQQDLVGQRVMPVPEATVRAMFMNNRAAEALARGRPELAYAFLREALRQDPAFLPGINTLGVLYLRSGHLQAAEDALRHVLAADPQQTSALGNLARVLEQRGRHDEAAALMARLRDLQPNAPFQRLDQGRAAMASGDHVRARELFTAELRQQPYQAEVHYWLALVNHELGDDKRAARHLALAAENATTRASQDLYAAKLQRLRTAGTAVP